MKNHKYSGIPLTVKVTLQFFKSLLKFHSFSIHTQKCFWESPFYFFVSWKETVHMLWVINYFNDPFVKFIKQWEVDSYVWVLNIEVLCIWSRELGSIYRVDFHLQQSYFILFHLCLYFKHVHCKRFVKFIISYW